ncbi:DNA cytosine methyltransferase [Pseudomonas lundensis]|uniref:DNA cytosine methyltransferase n=1 Tax=Pseudomonas lundensis TaxID=86185 RepID=UPI0039084043
MPLSIQPDPPCLSYGSVCSGIEAVTVAWQPLGLHPAWFAEIDPFPSAVLAQHYPHVPNLGDMTQLPVAVLRGAVAAPDLLVGGTPCQSFSVAGMRGGLNDPRGALSLKYVELADAIDLVRTRRGQPPTVLVWENVPGVLYDAGNAFGCFLGALAGEDCALQPAGGRWTDAGCVYGPRRAIAWRVLDAQYFGLAQRRRRVFLIASARSGFDPAEVLFECQSLRRDTAPSREAWPPSPALAATGTGTGHPGRVLNAYGGGNRSGPIDIAACLNARGQRLDFEVETLVFSENSRAEVRLQNGDGRISGALSTGGGTPGQGYPCVFSTVHAIQMAHTGSHGAVIQCELSHTLEQSATLAVHNGFAPRRLMPHECEVLQGLPRGYTRMAWRGRRAKDCPDGPRYKAIGNSMAVPCLGWIGRRLMHALVS